METTGGGRVPRHREQTSNEADTVSCGEEKRTKPYPLVAPDSSHDGAGHQRAASVPHPTTESGAVSVSQTVGAACVDGKGGGGGDGGAPSFSIDTMMAQHVGGRNLSPSSWGNVLIRGTTVDVTPTGKPRRAVLLHR